MSSSTKNDGENMKKFMFDTNDFDKQPEPEPEVVSYSEDQLVLAKNQSYAQGKAEGLAEAQAAQEKRLADLVEKLLGMVEMLIAAEDRREVESMMHATKLALRVTHKLLPQFAQKSALEEIERVIIENLDVRKDEPRIAVMVPTQHLEMLKARVDDLALQRGFAGKLILIADDAMGPSDCRVEWADGGAERLYERLFAQIEGEFAKSFAAMKTTLDGKNE